MGINKNEGGRTKKVLDSNQKKIRFMKGRKDIMKGKRKNIHLLLIAFCFGILITVNVKVSAKTYPFSGTYTGYNCSSYEKTRIVLNKNKTIKIYIDNVFYSKEKVQKIGTNKYKIPGYYVRIKLYGNKIKIYSSDGRDAKIPYGGVFKKIPQYKGKKLTSRQYNAIKGWWSQNSSGGKNVRFSKSGKITYYDRWTNRKVDYDVIYKVKKSGSGYMFYLYDNGFGTKYRFKYQGDTMEYYSGWKGNRYSGSSSMFRGKW